MPILPNPKKQQWTGIFPGKFMGDFIRAQNIDLEKSPGRLLLADRTKITCDSGDSGLSSLGIPVDFICSNVDGTQKFWALTSTGLFKTASVSTDVFAADGISGSPTSNVRDWVTYVDSSGVVHLLVSTSTSLYELHSTTWTSPYLSISAALSLGKLSNLILIGYGNRISTIDPNNIYVANRLVLDGNYVINAIYSGSDRMWAMGQMTSTKDAGIIYEWDGGNETVNNSYFLDGYPLMGFLIDDIPYFVIQDGRIVEFNGKAFQDIAYFPNYEEKTLLSLNVSVHGSQVNGNLVYLNLGAPTGSFRMRSGVWVFNVKTKNLYPIYSLGQYKTTEVDFGQAILPSVGGLLFDKYRINWLIGGTVSLDYSLTLSTGLVSYYKFDSNAVDIVGAHNGTVTGASSVVGILGNAYSFDGTNDNYITVADTASQQFAKTDDFTMNVWLKRTADMSGDSQERRIINKGTTGTQNGWSFNMQPNANDMVFVIGDGTSQNYGSSYFALPLNTWTMVTVVNSGSVLHTYVNGVLVPGGQALAYSGSSKNAVSLFIGNLDGSTPDFGFKGVIDEFSIFSRALSAAEISAIYNNGGALPYPLNTTKNVISTVSINDSNGNRGYFITPLLPSNNIEEFWYNLWVRFPLFVSNLNMINVKYRVADDLLTSSYAPVQLSITWIDATHFTAFLPTGIAVGNEVEILTGDNAGCLFHISNISDNFSGVTIDSYSESHQDDFDQVGQAGGGNSSGQTFTNTNISILTSCKFYLSLNPSFPSSGGTMTAKLYAMSGVYGSTGIPTGPALATSDPVNVSTLTTSFQLITFNFTGINQVGMSPGTYYVIVLDGSQITGFAIFLGTDSSTPTASGNYVTGPSTWSASSAIDVCFYVYGLSGNSTVTIDESAPKVSTGVSLAEFNNWVKISVSNNNPITSSSLRVQHLTTGDATKSTGPYVQFKVELRGILTGVDQLRTDEATQTEADL